MLRSTAVGWGEKKRQGVEGGQGQAAPVTLWSHVELQRVNMNLAFQIIIKVGG